MARKTIGIKYSKQLQDLLVKDCVAHHEEAVALIKTETDRWDVVVKVVKPVANQEETEQKTETGPDTVEASNPEEEKNKDEKEEKAIQTEAHTIRF